MFRLRVTVLLRHTKIDHVDDIRGLGVRSADQEIVWFDVAIYQVLLMDGLYTGKLMLSVTQSSHAVRNIPFVLPPSPLS